MGAIIPLVRTPCAMYTMGDSLYQSIGQGDIYPLYDRFWYNGVQMMRYWAPLPVYVLALCQMFVGGSALQGYLLYVAMIFFTGALVWLCLGIHNNRPVLGAFMGALMVFPSQQSVCFICRGKSAKIFVHGASACIYVSCV